MKRLRKYILCPIHVNGAPNQAVYLKYLDNPHDCDQYMSFRSSLHMHKNFH